MFFSKLFRRKKKVPWDTTEFRSKHSVTTYSINVAELIEWIDLAIEATSRNTSIPSAWLGKCFIYRTHTLDAWLIDEDDHVFIMGDLWDTLVSRYNVLLKQIDAQPKRRDYLRRAFKYILSDMDSLMNITSQY